MSYLHEDFRYYYLLGISAVILSVFALFGRARYRVAWYFSISAPGAFLIALQLTSIVYTNWSRWDKGFLLAFVEIWILVIFLPVYWVAPIVFFKQCLDLKRHRLVEMDRQAFQICTVLVALYLWCDLATKIAHLLAET